VASEALGEQLAADGVPPGLLRVVPPGRDLAAASGPPPGDLRRGRQAALLCVANWVARKGLHDLLDAFARLPPPTGTLHLAGDDGAEPRYAARLRARLARPDLAGRVVVHGPLPRERVAALYHAADVFVLPSIREPYGTVYGEAMAAGLPVVGWRAGNLPHLADDGKEGLLVAPGDLDGLARELARLAGDPALRRRLGAAARRRALARPTWAESAARFFGAIREVVEAGDAARG
jgi:glycosyltransferase involved in cell wall biosynthesis